MISACTGTPPSPISSKATNTITLTILPSLPSPTNTATKPNPTATSLPTQTPSVAPTPTPDTGIIQNCLPIISELPKDFNYSGVITGFNPPNGDGLGWDSLLVLKTMTNRPIKAGSYTTEIQVSPNRTLYAYQVHKAQQVIILAADGRIKKIIATPYNWVLSRWLDNQRLLMIATEPDPKIDQTVRQTDKYPETIAVLNPLTGEKLIFPPDYPDIDQTIWHNFDSSGSTLYDPALTRVVYPGAIEGKGRGYILWDIQGKRRLAQLSSPFSVESPKWSPDGSKFIVNGQGGEFFLVSRDGDIKQITHYNPNYRTDQNRHNFYSQFYSWSPDGKQVALWLNSNETNNTSLAILDPSTGDTLDLCIAYGSMPNVLPFWPDPVWSPDGKYIIIGANFQPDQNTNDLVLVDLEKGLALKIADNYSPNGWLKEP
jgi:dipeptidyl aminopeptidase/acylaminoacyl peptidase